MTEKLHLYSRPLRNAALALCALSLVVLVSATGADDAWATPRVKPTKEKTAKTVRFAAKPVVGVVNINTATAAELQTLPGIGPSKATRIVEYREKRGPFRRVRDLRRVKGIGRKTLSRLAKHIVVKGQTTIRRQ